MADKYHELQKQLGRAAANGDFAKAAEIRQEIRDTWSRDSDNAGNAPADQQQSGQSQGSQG
jgi:protein-arginine kinase activator protein McsA